MQEERKPRQVGPNKSLNRRLSEHTKSQTDALQSERQKLRAQSATVTQAAAKLAAAQSLNQNGRSVSSSGSLINGESCAGTTASSSLLAAKSAGGVSANIEAAKSVKPAAKNVSTNPALGAATSSVQRPKSSAQVSPSPAQGAATAASLVFKNHAEKSAASASSIPPSSPSSSGYSALPSSKTFAALTNKKNDDIHSDTAESASLHSMAARLATKRQTEHRPDHRQQLSRLGTDLRTLSTSPTSDMTSSTGALAAALKTHSARTEHEAREAELQSIGRTSGQNMSALNDALKTHSTKSVGEEYIDNPQQNKSALAAALAARDNAVDAMEKIDQYQMAHPRRKKRSKYRPSALWSGAGISHPMLPPQLAPSKLPGFPLANIWNLSQSTASLPALFSHGEPELASPVPRRSADVKFFEDFSGPDLEASAPLEVAPRQITSAGSAGSKLYSASHLGVISSTESLAKQEERSLGAWPNSPSRSMMSLPTGLDSQQHQPTPYSSTTTVHKDVLPSASKTSLFGLFRRGGQSQTPSPSSPVGQATTGFKSTMRKQRKKRIFNEDKPWKNHHHAYIPTESERKRYERLWAANKGIHWPFMAEQDREEIESSGRDPKDDIHGLVVRDLWKRSKLSPIILERIWDLVDRNRDGTLDRDGFLIGMWLVDQSLYGRKLPAAVDASVWNSVARLNVKIRIKPKDIRQKTQKHDKH